MIYQGIDSQTREHVYTYGADPESDRNFGRKVFSSRAGHRYFEEFDSDTERDVEVILQAVNVLYGQAPKTVDMFTHTLEVLMDRAPAADRWTPGKLKRKAPEPAPVEESPVEVPVDRNGRPLTAAQIKWSEYIQFSNQASSEQRKEKIRTDPGYASFVRTNLRREMNSAPIDAATVLNERTEMKAAPPELIAWVNEYRTTPMTTVRQRMRCDFNPGGYVEYNKMFNEAVEFGLI